jgi:hypothetical protein
MLLLGIIHVVQFKITLKIPNASGLTVHRDYRATTIRNLLCVQNTRLYSKKNRQASTV